MHERHTLLDRLDIIWVRSVLSSKSEIILAGCTVLRKGNDLACV